MRKIKLTQGYYALVDDEDYQRVSQFKWYASVRRSRYTGAVINVYAMHKTANRAFSLHRLILGVTDSKVKVDHQDSNGLNNCRYNLRSATHTQNMRNMRLRPDNQAGYKGVCFTKSKAQFKRHWKASITVAGVETFLGYHTTAKQAALAYDAKARELFGEFAYTNF